MGRASKCGDTSTSFNEFIDIHASFLCGPNVVGISLRITVFNVAAGRVKFETNCQIKLHWSRKDRSFVKLVRFRSRHIASVVYYAISRRFWPIRVLNSP